MDEVMFAQNAKLIRTKLGEINNQATLACVEQLLGMLEFISAQIREILEAMDNDVE